MAPGEKIVMILSDICQEKEEKQSLQFEVCGLQLKSLSRLFVSLTKERQERKEKHEDVSLVLGITAKKPGFNRDEGDAWDENNTKIYYYTHLTFPCRERDFEEIHN